MATPAGTPAARRPHPALRRALRITAVLLVLLVLGGAAFGYWLVARAQPTLDGTVRVPGLTAPVSVVRDASGIPHITARTAHDLYLAQGYVHAQDRLWEMDVFRRAGSGRLAELFGAPGVALDRALRILGLNRIAAASLAATPPDARAALDAYAAGVNAFIAGHRDALPLEYLILGATPAPWTAEDSLAFGAYQAFNQNNAGMVSELLTADLQAHTTPATLAQLMPLYPAGEPLIIQTSARPAGVANRPAFLSLPGLALGGPGTGTNHWVVAGARTTTGRPLLADDPHLGVSNPSPWYINHLRTADGAIDVAGTSFPGAPGIVIGHNQDIAWGITNLPADVEDLYTETLDPAAHPGQYLDAGTWRPLTLLTETIHVKDAPDVQVPITRTAHGVLINPLYPDLAQPTTVQWTADRALRTFTAVLHLQTAHDWATFRAALAEFDAPGQNFVFADTRGNIGYQATGLVPIRKQGNGSVPVDGASGAYGWTGFIPFDQMPSAYNPPQGYLVTANNRIVGDSYPYLLTTLWTPGYRAARITQLLAATPKVSPDDSRRIQTDIASAYAAGIGKYFAALPTGDPQVQPLVQRFAGWDGTLSAGSTTAAVYEVAYTHLLSTTATNLLGGALSKQYLDKAGDEAAIFIAAALAQPTAPWWDDPTTPAHEDRDAVLLGSLRAAATDLTAAFGADPAGWQWGKLHQIGFPHQLGGVPPLDKVFNLGPYPASGDNTTVNAAYFQGTASYTQLAHPSTRQVTDVGNWDAMTVIIAPGQSGQPFARHWGDLTADWLAGRARPLPFSPAAVQAAAVDTLTLQP
jgi:penicillin amidase